ncbi:HAD hydrolase family protein [Caloramator sp. mosi_1]|nr:HAD hydrolase family protein [Caloramator sp. mosi_1]WDC83622.1 HAD hydrolase family protein [Caloramator sp. mosi_1]
MNFSGILVVSDMDGTLMDSNKNISKRILKHYNILLIMEDYLQ